MTDRRYEVRVTGRLSDIAQAAFAAADVAEAAADTVISGLVHHDRGPHELLTVIHSLGLHIKSVQEMGAPDRPLPPGQVALG